MRNSGWLARPAVGHRGFRPGQRLAEHDDAAGDDLRGTAHLEPGPAAGVECLHFELQAFARCYESSQSQSRNFAEGRGGARGGQRAKRQVEEAHAWKDWTSREVTLVERPGRRNDKGKPVHARTAAIAATTNDGQTSRIRAMSG
jgi:hypothetical protein